MALWSRNDPVTVFGAKMSAPVGPSSSRCSTSVASWFSDSTQYEFEVIAAGASGDLAYTVGYEHNQVKVDGRPRTYTLRVTHVYRREDGRVANRAPARRRPAHRRRPDLIAGVTVGLRCMGGSMSDSLPPFLATDADSL